MNGMQSMEKMNENMKAWNEWAMDNEGRGHHRTCENEESKENMEMNGNKEMKWNERIGMEMNKSKIERSVWEEEWDGNR